MGTDISAFPDKRRTEHKRRIEQREERQRQRYGNRDKERNRAQEEPQHKICSHQLVHFPRKQQASALL